MRIDFAVLFVLTGIVATPLGVRAESADKVVERFIDAIGGKKAVERILTTEVAGIVTFADGRSGEFTQRMGRPYLLVTSVSGGAGKWRTGFNGRAAWADDDRDGVRTLYGAPAARLRAEATWANARYLLPDKISQVSIERDDEVRGRPVVVLLAVMPDGTARKLFFDTGSHLLVKDEQETEAGVEERFLGDYRRVGEVMEPHRVEWRRDGETHLIAVERVAHNGPIDASMFDAPAPALQPPLDVETVLSAARRGEAQAQALRAPYAYTRTSRSRTLDGGDVRQDDSYSYEIFHLGDGAPVFRMIDRNGQGLSERQRRSEDERVAEMVARYERDRLSGQRRDRGRTQSRSSGSIVFLEPLARRDWLDAYVRMADFGSLRRERVLSRAALVLEFEPKGRARPSGDFERQTHSMAGAIWIDEATHQVMRIESWLRDGVGAFVPGSSFRAERVFVGDEVWLPSIDQTNLRHTRGFGRPFLFFGANEYFDHKKFGVTFDSTIALPDVEP